MRKTSTKGSRMGNLCTLFNYGILATINHHFLTFWCFFHIPVHNGTLYAVFSKKVKQKNVLVTMFMHFLFTQRKHVFKLIPYNQYFSQEEKIVRRVNTTKRLENETNSGNRNEHLLTLFFERVNYINQRLHSFSSPFTSSFLKHQW